MIIMRFIISCFFLLLYQRFLEDYLIILNKRVTKIHFYEVLQMNVNWGTVKPENFGKTVLAVPMMEGAKNKVLYAFNQFMHINITRF